MFAVAECQRYHFATHDNIGFLVGRCEGHQATVVGSLSFDIVEFNENRISDAGCQGSTIGDNGASECSTEADSPAFDSIFAIESDEGVPIGNDDAVIGYCRRDS